MHLLDRVQTPSGFPRSASSEIRMGWVPSLRRAAVSTHRFNPFPYAAFAISPSWSAIVSGDLQFRRLRRFTCVHPSILSLAWVPRMARFPLGFTTLLHTLPLPATHGVIGNRFLDTSLGLSSTSRCDLVSQGVFAYPLEKVH